jgi:hypothetical protein
VFENKFLFCSIILIAASTAFSQGFTSSGDTLYRADTIQGTAVKPNNAEYSAQKLQEKLHDYTRMEKTGKTLFYVGLPLTVAGLLSYVGSALTLADGNKSVGVPLAVIAVAGIGFGPEMTVIGAVLKRVGKTKKREYEDKVSVKIGLNCVSMQYMF